MDQQLAAVLSFVSLGANLLGAVLLLLLNSGSRSVRWYLPFQCAIILWLLGQGCQLMWPRPLWESLNMFAVTLMPLLFLLFAWMESSTRPNWHGLVALLAAAPLVPYVLRSLYVDSPLANATTWLWMIGGWMGGSIVMWAGAQRSALERPVRTKLLNQIVLLSLILVAPLSVIASMIFNDHGPWFITYVMPLVMMWVLFLIFYGVTRMQFYDIEVRVRRSGDIAAETVEMERLAVLGELAATVAHEVRNPLTGMRSLAQRLAHEDVTPEKRRKYGEVILEETGRVERLVTNLLELSRRGARKEASAATATPLAPLFEDLVLLIASRAERAGVTLDVRANDVTAGSSREALAQALLNLLLNAIAHSPDGGRVEMVAAQVNGAVEIVVRDQGTGVPLADRDRIFEAFYTSTPDGTGLGLSVLRHLVREHDWRVTVGDAPSQGAEFRLSIPNLKT